MNKYKMLFVTTLCSLLPTLLYSQLVDTAWVRRYNGPSNGYDAAYDIAVDGQGNVYVTGYSYQNGINIADYATIKYNSLGVQQWVTRYNGPGNDIDKAWSLAIDGQSNVYVTGESRGSGTYNDYATIKYNVLGVQQWVARYDGLGNSTDAANDIAVDGQGNVYVTGYSSGATVYYDYATIKYNSLGVQQWAARYNGPADDWDYAVALAVDGQGNVYVTGGSNGSGNFDYVTIKYDSNGDSVWVSRYNGPANSSDMAKDLVIDGQGNVYVTGSSINSGAYDYTTIKYYSNGDTAWVSRYNGSGNGDDEANVVAVDGQGNVYVTGYSTGSGANYDYTTIKYDDLGVQQWVARYNGPGNSQDIAYGLAVDGQGNVYVTGFVVGSGAYNNYTTIKYNAFGVQQWVALYDGPGNGHDKAWSLAIDGPGNVYVTGYSYGLGTDYDYATIKYTQGSGIEENRSSLPADRLSLEVYPNPAKAFFTIRSSFLALHSTLKLYDVTGKIVKSEELKDSNNRISLDGIKNGVYFVKVGNEMVKEKLVVTK
jgi:hypothetical protein